MKQEHSWQFNTAPFQYIHVIGRRNVNGIEGAGRSFHIISEIPARLLCPPWTYGPRTQDEFTCVLLHMSTAKQLACSNNNDSGTIATSLSFYEGE
jgi:hypothetical protein